MTYRIFGAIDVGSYEVNLKIYELSMKNGIRLLNHVRHRLEVTPMQQERSGQSWWTSFVRCCWILSGS